MALDEKIRRLERNIMAHQAMGNLDAFGANLARQPMDSEQQKVFFASMRAFFKDIPTGILALALRVSDDWERFEPYEGTAKGAYILFADVDEYGLQDQHVGIQKTHHQLFRDLTEHLGISVEDLQNPKYIVPAGPALGDTTTRFYRESPVPEGLGFHLASETTSCREFVHFLRGFQAHADHYKLNSENDPVLDFFQVHIKVEPLHKSNGRKIMELYQSRNPATIVGVRSGAMEFMDGFGDLFSQINKRIYNGNGSK